MEKEQVIDTSPAVYPTCGALLNMRRYTSKITPVLVKHAKDWGNICAFTMSTACINPWAIGLRQKSTLLTNALYQWLLSHERGGTGVQGLILKIG